MDSAASVMRHPHRAPEPIGDFCTAQGAGRANESLQEYWLNTHEGVALLSLDEADL